MGRFNGKVALITGAASGIGRAITVRMSAEGASVLAADIDRTGLAEIASVAPGRVIPHELDVGDPEACKEAVASCIEEFSRLDVLGNVAGIFLPAHTTDTTVEQYRRVIAVNMDGPFFLSQAAIPHLLKSGGSIVNIASNSGIQGVPYAAAYGMSKGGVLQLTKSLAVEYIKTAIRVNAIAPAGCNTNIAATVQFPEGMDIDLATRMAGLRGMAEPEEVAALFAFLASDEAPSITGAVYTIDNGITVS
jgi:meso-butanediol dehydrogenase/(S,S)-butanediol dehydrogenase/diacetyl reductase